MYRSLPHYLLHLISPTDDSTYDTVFQTKNGYALILRLHFPPTGTAPQMTLVGIRATHPWLDRHLRVTGYLPIQSKSAWENSGLLLGEAVNAVVQHFQLNPPELFEIIDENLKRIQSRLAPPNVSSAPPNVSSQSGNTLYSSAQVVQEEEIQSDLPPHFRSVLKFNTTDASVREAMMSNVHIPSAPTEFPESSDITLSDANELLQSEAMFVSTLEGMPYVKTMLASRESVTEETLKIAQSNLEKEEELKEKYDEVKDLQKSLKEKIDTFNKLQNKQERLLKPTDKRTALSKLQVAKRDAFNESEEIASDWINNGLNIDDFIDSFIEKRTVHHVRAAKIERMQYL